MSWSFSVTEDNAADALRQFANGLFDNQAHIPETLSNRLDYSARSLSESVAPDMRVTLATDGHFNADGSGNCRVSMIVAKLPEHVPNLPDDQQPGAQEEGTNEA